MPTKPSTQNVRLHVGSDGITWAMSKCKICGDVSKHPVADAMAGPMPCPRCGHRMDMTGSAAKAIAIANESRQRPPEAAD
jgi:hypothetical protein